MTQEHSDRKSMRYQKTRKKKRCEEIDMIDIFKYQREQLRKELQYSRYIIVVLVIITSLSLYLRSNYEDRLAIIESEFISLSEKLQSHGITDETHECLACDEQETISKGITDLFVNRLLDGNATKEDESILSEAIDSYLSGLLNQAGAVTVNGIVSYFKESKVDDSPNVMIHFDIGRFDIPISGREKLKRVCRKIDTSSRTIEVSGHADLTGNEVRNLTLAKDRQQNVIQWIKDECTGFKGRIKPSVNYNRIPIMTVSNQSEPENRVVIVKL